MDSQRKAIQGLTASLDEKRAGLLAFYGKFGSKLLSDSVETVDQAPAIPRERIDAWQSLMKSREADTGAILDIKAAVSRMHELQRFKRELDRNLAAENLRYREQLEGIGKAIFDRYSEFGDSIRAQFEGTRERASVEGNTLSRLEEKRERLRMELEESGFFGQMLVQFRMAGLASNIRLHKNRFLSILSDGAEKLVSSGIIEDLRESGTLDSRSSGFYAVLGEVASRRDELKLRAESLEDDQSMVRSTLEQYAASDNPSRRIDDLRFRIKETDKRIDALVILSAREYCDKFIDDDGISVLGGGAEGQSFGDMGAYSRYLEDVAHLRSEVSEIRGKIEILETKIKIETIERNIAVWERSCGEAERKISMLQEQIVKLGKNIEEAGIERGRLADHLENLEKTL